MTASQVKVGGYKDMSRLWENNSLLYNIYTQKEGATITLRIPNTYVSLAGVQKLFNKDVIYIHSESFVKLVENQYKNIVSAAKSHTKNALQPEIDLGDKDVDWQSPTINKVVTASLTNNTAIKYIGNVKSSPSVDDLRDTPFKAYVVLSMPLIYVNMDSKKITTPVHVKTIGLVGIEDDLSDIDVRNLSLA